MEYLCQMENFRVAIITNKGRVESNNFETRDQVDNYILSFDKEETVKSYRIKDIKTGNIIETEQGVRNG